MISALLAAALSLNGSCDSRFEGNKPLETAGHGLEGRPGPDGHEPRPKLYVKFAGENKHLPLPFGTWSVTTMVFGKKGEWVKG